ncbi:MAG: hypothetical protein Q9191_001002 [Dirinaria sp. TL-2023a]
MQGIVLKRLGHNVRILERSPSNLLDGQGAGIMAGEKLQEFLKKHDYSQEPYFIPLPQIHFFDRAANMTRVWKMELRATSWNTLYYRLRANYDGLLSPYVSRAPERGDAEGKAIYEYATTVTDLQLIDGLVTVSFESLNHGSGSYQADLVIAADGPSSNIRQRFYPDLERKYVGYAAWRGTVAERDVSSKTKERFEQYTNYFIGGRGHILQYTIPGKNGSLGEGERLLNYVWYCNYPEGSKEHADLMTDSENHRHRVTIPMGKMRDEAWTAQKEYAQQILPAPFAELIIKTQQPFVQCITDVNTPRACHLDGKLLFVGDALCTFRPHVGSSTNQAALNALLLESVMAGEMTLQQWEDECLDYAQITSLTSMVLGNKNQFSFFTFLVSAVWLAKAHVGRVFSKGFGALPNLRLVFGL